MSTSKDQVADDKVISNSDIPVKKTSATTNFLIGLIGSAITGLIYYVVIFNKDSDNIFSLLKDFWWLFLLFFLAFLFSLSISTLILLFKFIKLMFGFLGKRPIFIFPVVLILCICSCGGSFLISKSQYYLSNDTFELLNNELTSLYYLRSIRDDLAEGRSVAGWDMDILLNRVYELDVEMYDIGSNTGIWEPYYTSIASWYIGLNDALIGNITWEEAGVDPEFSDVKLDDWQLQDSYQRSVERVLKLRSAGDLMIATNNREGMRSVAASLAVELYWMRNLVYTDDPGILGDALIVINASDHKRSTPCLNRNGISVCSDQMATKVEGVYRSARNYTAGDPDAATSWTGSWDAVNSDFSQMGQPIPESGITVSEEDPNIILSPVLQAFNSECNSKGGIVGGSGGVMERLPVATSGWTCWYGEDNKCWDFLTYSYSRFKGGGGTCEEEGLIPEAVPAIFDTIGEDIINGFDSIFNGISSQGWDGNYTFTISGTKCSGSGSDYADFSSILNGDGSIMVRNNRIQNYDEGNIDETGHAISVFNVTGMNVTLDVQFSINEDVKMYEGTFHVRQALGGYLNLDCTGKASGVEE